MKKLLSSRYFDPVLIILINLVAFVPQLHLLGFVMDDWVYIDFYSFHGLDGLITYTFMIDSRPFAFWVPWIGFQLFGTSPLPWQFWTLGWNILSTLMVWLVFRRLFPTARQQNILAAVLFGLYPLYFFHQYSALQLCVHAACYFLLGLSFYLTMRATQNRRRWFLFTLGAVLTSFVQILTTEFFAGLELARVVMIFFLISKEVPGWKSRLLQTLKQWLPYLLIWLFWLAWRVALMPRPSNARNEVSLVADLLKSPLSTLATLVQYAIQDTALMLSGVWSRTIQSTALAFTPISNLAGWVLAVLIVAVFLFVFWKMGGWKEEKPYPWQASLAGLGMMLLGFLPGWAIGQQMAYFTDLSDRFGMAAIPGAVLVLVTLAGFFLRNRLVQNIVLIGLVGLAVSFQFRSLAPYRYAWEQQQDLYWQLKWRAPSITPQTAFLGNGQLIANMGDWFLTPALDHLYAVTRPTINPVYYYFDVNDNFEQNFSADRSTLHKTKYNRDFQSKAADSLVLQYGYGTGRCLWILTKADVDNPYLADELVKYLPLSNLARISDGSDTPADEQAFGSSYPLNWCYFYQKARLAEQFSQWDKVVDLWGQAAQKGFRPKSGVEYLPFIKAASLTGKWELAVALSERANNPKEQMQTVICRTWVDIENRYLTSLPDVEAIQKIRKNLGCVK